MLFSINVQKYILLYNHHEKKSFFIIIKQNRLPISCITYYITEHKRHIML